MSAIEELRATLRAIAALNDLDVVNAIWDMEAGRALFGCVAAARRLGHSAHRTTADIYCHADPGTPAAWTKDVLTLDTEAVGQKWQPLFAARELRHLELAMALVPRNRSDGAAGASGPMEAAS